MSELLILFSLLDEKLTIYEIKQKIEKLFFLFLKISFGSIHPTLKKFEEKGFVKVKKSLSSGGQRSSIYSITESGKEHFLILINEDFPDNPAITNQLITVKYIMSLKLEKEVQNSIKKNILTKLKEQKDFFSGFVQKSKDYDKEYIDFIKYYLQETTAKIEWLNSTQN